MTPTEKAKELIWKYLPILDGWTDNKKTELAKQCALIALELRLDGAFLFSSIEYGDESLEYWEQVKEEIEKL